MRRAPTAGRVTCGVAALALLVLVLPLLGAALALGPGGLPHESAFQAHAGHDVSAAALEQIDRWLHGDLAVLPAAPAAGQAVDVMARAAPARLFAAAVPSAAAVAAEAERRF